MTKKSLDDCMMNGGAIKIAGTTVLFDYPNCTDHDVHPSGYFIKNSLGYRVYFKCRERKKAQDICNQIFGKNHYTVRNGGDY